MIGKKINQLATELAPASTDLTIIGNPTTGVSKKITLAQLGAIFSGAVSFYTNYAAFPTPGTTDVIFCAKDTQKLYLWSGSAYVEVFPSQALLDTYQLRSEKGNANGYASLDSSGKVPISQLPSSIMEYKGTWSAATNTPTLANGTGDTGDVYLCNAAGTVNFGAGPLTFAVGDYVVYSGTIWQRSSGAVGTVTSVAASITGNAIGITGSPVTTSGTLALAFAGTSAQYVNGAGNLITFPSIISQAQNLVTEVYNETGATLTKGTIVYINGGHGNLPTVTKALATGDSTSAQTYGIVQADITNNNNGYVVAAGRLENIDTQAYTAGTQLYLSSTTAGTWTSTKQYAPAHLVYVGIIVRSHPTQGIVEVKIQNGYELDEIHNVSAQTPSNNDGLFWEASTSLWKNKSIATILGYTPQAQLNGTGFVKASGTTITYDNSTYVTTDTFQTISASKTFSVGFSIASAGGTNQLTSFVNTNSIHSGSAGTNVFGFNNSNNIYFGKGLSNGGVITYNNSAVRFYALPDADGTIALVGGAGVGTVTSVGLSSSTSGVTIGSTPITTSGTITLAIATASGSQQGLLSSTDWTTFNNKQSALTNPVTGTGNTNYLPKFTGTSTIGNSAITDDGTTVSLISRALSGVSATFTNSSGETITLQKGSGPSIKFSKTAATAQDWALAGEGSAFKLYNYTAGTTPLMLDTSGNLGLGVTPSAWGVTGKVLEIGGAGGNGAWFNNGQNDMWFVSNTFYNGSNWVYKDSATATQYYQGNGHKWYTAPSGTAGNAISFTQAMTLNASGNLSIGNTNDTFKLDVSGQIYSSANYGFRNYDGTNGGDSWQFGSNAGAFTFRNISQSTSPLILASTGAATFSSSVTAGNLVNIKGIYPFVQFLNTSDSRQAYIQHDLSNLVIQSDVGAIVFNAATERMRITSGGNVGIGTTSPSALVHAYKSSASAVIRADYNGTTTIDMTASSSGNAYISSNTTLIFENGSTPTERMRISNGGILMVGTSTTLGGGGSESVNGLNISSSGLIVNNSTGDFNAYFAKRSGYTFGGILGFYVNGSQVGSISTNGSSTTYNTSSDYRLKTDYKDFSGLDLVNKIKAYDYEWKSDKSRSYGVIAHELQSVINYAVTGIKDGKEMQGVDYSKIVPVLIKAIQEQQQQIEQLKNK